MATLLHLTDLHLATPDDWAGGDFSKSDIVPLRDRPDRLTALQTTLRALAQSPRCPELDAVVITGDIAFQNGRETPGWEQWANALQPLADGGKLPAHDRIVVTPGNHDVTWRKAIGDPDHYQRFLEHVRRPGYTTPMLDRIDFNEDGQITSTARHYLLDVDLRFVVVPINSSHYCGVLEPIGHRATEEEWNEAIDKLRGVDGDLATKVMEEVTWLREHDVARISEPQFNALTAMINEIKDQAAEHDLGPEDLVWIGAVHHHLLPVTTLEEFKSFESITNLGRFRQFLVDAGFDLLLHGHKHSAGIYWDHVHRNGELLDTPEPQVLVVSGSTLGSQTEGADEIGRLLDIEPASDRRAVVISKIPVLDHAARLPDALISQRANLWQAKMALEVALPHVLTGKTTSDLYQRLQALFASLPAGQGAVADLLCEVRSPTGAEKPPDGYPIDRTPGGPDRATDWFKETVQWWQRKSSKLQFTHGQRLRAWGADEIDQVEEAILLLQNDSISSRAVITLIDPASDKVSREDSKFPAFSFAHLLIRQLPGQSPRLDCIGLFRKQEMRFWWPINVAELARLQEHVFNRLNRPDLRYGSIITYASIAHVGTDVPAVNVTAVDRLADEAEDRLWDMAYGVAHADSVDREQVKADWMRILTDLEPSNGDQLPRPRLGLQELERDLKRFSKGPGNTSATEIDRELRTLINAYDSLAKGAGDPSHWREQISDALAAIREQIESLFSV